MYGSQDPLGVVPNPATPYGYVGNPVLWVDPDALKACPNYPSLISKMISEVHSIRNSDESLRGVFNVAGMMDKEGNLYFASGAAHNLNPADYPGLNIVTLGSPAEWKGLEWYERLPFHAEQKLLNYAKANNIDVAAIHTPTLLPPCPTVQRWKKMVVNGLIHGKKTCEKLSKMQGWYP